MKIQVQIEHNEWFCLGWMIQKNDHPNLPPFSTFPADEKPGSEAHWSMKEAVSYCIENPNLSSNVTLDDFSVHRKRPKITEGVYYGVRWYYSESFHCYGCEVAEMIPFKSLAQVKRYIKDWHQTVNN